MVPPYAVSLISLVYIRLLNQTVFSIRPLPVHPYASRPSNNYSISRRFLLNTSSVIYMCQFRLPITPVASSRPSSRSFANPSSDTPGSVRSHFRSLLHRRHRFVEPGSLASLVSTGSSDPYWLALVELDQLARASV